MQKKETRSEKHKLFRTLLKKKGVGQTMSKTLTLSELKQLGPLFLSDDVPLSTKATLLTAFLMLDHDKEELLWFEKLRDDAHQRFPKDILYLIQQSNGAASNQTEMIDLIRLVVRKKDLSAEQMKKAIAHVLDTKIPSHLKAAFLESERLKEESPTENLVAFEYLWSQSNHYHVNGTVIIDLCNGYDGFNRNYYFTPFTAALLASVGYRCIVHGIDDMGPKHGINPYKLLNAAKKQPLLQPSKLLKDIENDDIGWAYIDQSISFPALSALKTLRTEMVKRPLLATLEKLLQPIRTLKGNYLVTSYTHPPYKQKSLRLLQEFNNTSKFLILRGLEGSIQLALDRRTPYIIGDSYGFNQGFLVPKEFDARSVSLELTPPISIDDNLKKGIDALTGIRGFARECIIYQAQVILSKFEFMDKKEARKLLSESIDSGKAISHWEKGMTQHHGKA